MFKKSLEEEFGIYEGFEYRKRKPTNNSIEEIGVNDSPFVVKPTINNKIVEYPAYVVWHAMLKRCYNSKYKERQPTYIGVTVCEDWLLFTSFAKWAKDNYIKGYQLDKDILVKDNKVYSPDTCIFLPAEINSFLACKHKGVDELPIGVDFYMGKFRSQISKYKIKEYLGLFDSSNKAHREWQKAKLEQAIAFNFPPLQRVINQLTYEIKNNLETTTL